MALFIYIMYYNYYVLILLSIIVYSDGMGRTGTFICIHAMLERMNSEGVVDFFQFIKASRINQPNIVREQVLHHFIILLHHFL